MKRNLFVISESERKRILGMHKDATRKQYLSEQTQYIKDAAGKVSILQGPKVVPQGSTVITQQEYETALKTQQPPANQSAPAPAAPATATPAPAEPNQNNAQGGDTSATSKFGVDYKYNYPGDKSYVYGYKDGKWYTKNVTKNVEFDLSTNPKCKSAIDNLNKQFASQIKEPTTPSTATDQNNAPLPTKSLSSMTVQNNVANQQLATGPVRSGQEIRQDYRQQQRQERQGARQERRDTKQIEKQLKDLQATYQRLQGKMTPNDKLAYENQIKQLKTQLGQQG